MSWPFLAARRDLLSGLGLPQRNQGRFAPFHTPLLLHPLTPIYHTSHSAKIFEYDWLVNVVHVYNTPQAPNLSPEPKPRVRLTIPTILSIHRDGLEAHSGCRIAHTWPSSPLLVHPFPVLSLESSMLCLYHGTCLHIGSLEELYRQERRGLA